NQEQSLVSALITKGLGGKGNISDVDCCATRLRCTVHNIEEVKDEFLTESGAKGIVKKGNGVQIIYGPHVSVIKSNLEEYLDHGAIEDAATEVKEVIYAPCKGRVGDLSETPDDTFAKEMLGKGIVIFPTDTKFYAPFDGEVQFVFDTKHALGLTTSNQTEVLLHIGIDTVHLKGEGFHVYVEAGQKIKKGDLLVEIDLQYIKEHAKSEATPLVFTSLKPEETIIVKKMGEVNALEEILEIK
ncbi:MAG: glucose PTS transporter subunit IIA, partial [Erysipelotrichaceae bacterium]|nr:glucose PTS transporter subunit IIA [Erysipelotrichaceae bacterium]